MFGHGCAFISAFPFPRNVPVFSCVMQLLTLVSFILVIVLDWNVDDAFLMLVDFSHYNSSRPSQIFVFSSTCDRALQCLHFFYSAYLDSTFNIP